MFSQTTEKPDLSREIRERAAAAACRARFSSSAAAAPRIAHVIFRGEKRGMRASGASDDGGTDSGGAVRDFAGFEVYL